jgi:heme/copper-type cytochrome/quinol oxidase subunit 4
MKKYLLLLIALFFPIQALAAGDITVSPDPIFNITNWAPGQTQTQEVTISNTTSVDRSLGLKMTATKTELSDFISLKVVQKWDGSILLEKKVSELYQSGEIGLGIIPAQSDRKFDFSATLSPDLGNEYQGAVESFDLSFGFFAEEAPDYEEQTTPGNPVNTLISNLRNAVTTLTPNVNQQVSGEDTQPKDVKGATNTDTNKKAETPCPWWWIVGLILAISLAVYSLVVRRTKRDDEKIFALVAAVPAVLSIVAWIAHYYLHRSADYTNTIYCDYFWLIALIEALIAYFLYYYLFQREQKDTD